MKVVTELSQIPPFPKPIAVTIGSFDGVHLGHQHLLKKMRERVSSEGTVALLTFRNHPSQVLNNRPPVPQLTSIEQKLDLLEKAGVNLVLLLTFTEEFSKQPFEIFLKTLKDSLPFSYLVLGCGASFGKDRQGDEKHVKECAKHLGFKAEYIEKIQHNGSSISSGTIRSLIEQGEIAKASSLLGRPLS